MRDEVQAYLDGELSFEQLPTELRAEARRWERLLGDVRQSGPAGAPAGLEARVMRAISARRRPAWRRAFSWMLRPQPIRVPPVAALAIAAALALLVLRPWSGPEDLQGPDTTTASVMYVQFSLDAPSARSVAVAGDFTGWRPEIPLHDSDGDGVWTGSVPVRRGLHQYMFVVDGERWVTDPRAERYADDGFGNRNAVLVVAPPARS